MPGNQQILLEFLSVFNTTFTVRDLISLPYMQFFYSEDSLKDQVKELVLQRWLQVPYRDIYKLDPQFVDFLTVHSIEQGRFDRYADVILKEGRKASHKDEDSYYYSIPESQRLRDLRIHALRDNFEQVHRILKQKSFRIIQYAEDENPVQNVFGQLEQIPLLEHLSDRMLLQYVAPPILENPALPVKYVQAFLGRYRKAIASEPELGETSMSHSAEYLLWHSLIMGDADAPWCRSQFRENDICALPWMSYSAARLLVTGQLDEALNRFSDALGLWRLVSRRRKGGMENRFDIFFALGLLLKGDAASLKLAEEVLSPKASVPIDSEPLLALLMYRKYGKVDDTDFLTKNAGKMRLTDIYLLMLTCRVLQIPLPGKILHYATNSALQLAESDHTWLAAELYTAASFSENDTERAAQLARTGLELHAQSGTRPMHQLFSTKASWRQVLDAMQLVAHIAAPVKKPKRGDTTERLIWIIVRHGDADNPSFELQPVIQKLLKKGWNPGRHTSLKHLATNGHQMTFLSDADREIVRGIRRVGQKRYATYELDMASAWPHLIGHPLVFWAAHLDVPLRVEEGRPELQVRDEPDGTGVRVSLVPRLPRNRQMHAGMTLVVEESKFQVRVYRITAELYQLYRIIEEGGIVVPKDARSELNATMDKLAAVVPLHAEAPHDQVRQVEPDSRIRIVLVPYNEGLRLMMRVMPLGDRGPAFVPGEGRRTVVGVVDDLKVGTERSLESEMNAVGHVLQSCDTLAEWEDPREDLFVVEPMDCLEVLEQLAALGDDVVLAWPEGRSMTVSRRKGPGDLRVSLSKSGQWFDLDGELQVDQEHVLSLQELLAACRESRSRFVPLGEGRFLSLTSRFLKLLSLMDRCAVPEGQKNLRVPELAGPALAELFDEVTLQDTDSAWGRQKASFKKASTRDMPFPAGLQVQLRDYQMEGFRWMMRMATWGAGCALADDMGLGKTVQAIAVLAARGKDGPALVVAPVSVCGNWIDECARFAPRLRTVLYRGVNREQVLAECAPNDVVVTSYGLLQSDIDALSKIHWSTVILDEAQAIKNTHALRTQAAYQLQAGFRVVTTGTPVENHLGELWSLFRFLNPGLLLSQKEFTERFQLPVERENDEASRHALRKLIQPFILRRTKAQVLKELPARTEILRHVEPGPPEQEFYEALRQNAMERLQDAGELPNRRMEILAEIMRLRLAACHPRLVLPDCGISSSKLQAFSELATELIENGHKALVFSQFVKHLALIREELDQAGIRYQYLDGSTPMEERRKRVDAFQSGVGDLFLISLKAGGFGLNLTAADYVIHMDPWWNPAVEDQASDRAHRIGQVRPVTVYRLVAKNTIEEKILRLHESKRELADRLLEGTADVGTLSAEDLLALIRG